MHQPERPPQAGTFIDQTVVLLTSEIYCKKAKFDDNLLFQIGFKSPPPNASTSWMKYSRIYKAVAGLRHHPSRRRYLPFSDAFPGGSLAPAAPPPYLGLEFFSSSITSLVQGTIV